MKTSSLPPSNLFSEHSVSFTQQKNSIHQFYLAVKFQSELDVFSLNHISSTMRVKVAQPLVGAGGGKGGSHMTQGGAHSRGAGQREPSRARQARAGIAALLGNRPALMTTKRPAFPGSGVLARQVLVLSVQCNVVRIEEDDTRVSCVPEAPSQRLLSLFVDRSQEPLPAAAPGAQGSRQGHASWRRFAAPFSRSCVPPLFRIPRRNFQLILCKYLFSLRIVSSSP